jgi:DNA-binding protein H-NS
MAEDREETLAESLGINLSSLDSGDRFSLVAEVFDTLTAGELREVRDLAEKKRQEKLEGARNAVIEEMRGKLEQMGIEPDQITVSFGRRRRARRDTGGTLPVKYKSPGGETWSGRGNVPNWLTALEEQGYNREEVRVDEEESAER